MDQLPRRRRKKGYAKISRRSKGKKQKVLKEGAQVSPSRPRRRQYAAAAAAAAAVAGDAAPGDDPPAHVVEGGEGDGGGGQVRRRSRRTAAQNSRRRLVYRLQKTDACVALLEERNNQLEEDLRQSMDREEEGAMLLEQKESRVLSLEKDLVQTRTRLDERTARFTQSNSDLKDKHKVKVKELKTQIEKEKDNTAAAIEDGREKTRVAVSAAEKEGEKRRQQSANGFRSNAKRIKASPSVLSQHILFTQLSHLLVLFLPLKKIAHEIEMKAKDDRISCIESDLYRKERDTGKIISSLGYKVESLELQNKKLQDEKDYDIALAVKQASRDERRHYSVKLGEERTVSRALRSSLKTTSAKQRVSLPFSLLLIYVSIAFSLPRRTRCTREHRDEETLRPCSGRF